MAVLLAFIVLAGASPSLAASPEPGMATAGKASKTDRVEVRIKELHTKLNITPAQEGLWDNVTKVMRDDAKTMEALIKARSEKATSMNAVDDLKSYSEITEAHAHGLKKFIRSSSLSTPACRTPKRRMRTRYSTIKAAGRQKQRQRRRQRCKAVK